jgi:hypothetical protein
MVQMLVTQLVYIISGALDCELKWMDMTVLLWGSSSRLFVIVLLFLM